MNFVVAVRDFEAADDSAALAHVENLCATHTVQITEAGRWVGEVKGTRRVKAR